MTGGVGMTEGAGMTGWWVFGRMDSRFRGNDRRGGNDRRSGNDKVWSLSEGFGLLIGEGWYWRVLGDDF